MRVLLVLSTLAVFLTRLPWLGAGYGSDPDAYRVVAVAREIAHGGSYDVSRLPGYPLYEYLTALSAGAAPWISNACTALSSAIAFLLFALILRQFQVRGAVLIALGFAMTPVVYLNSCCTMDYVPALTLMLAATYALLRGRPALAGLCLGLATGCRLTSGVLGLALCLWLWLEQPRRVAVRASVILGCTALLSAALCYAPVLRRYGLGFLYFYDNPSYTPLPVVYERALPLVWGALGLCAWAIWCLAAPCWARWPRRTARTARARHGVALALCACALYLALFLRLPDESAYLIPLVPFALLAAALLAPPRLSAALAAALCASSFIAIDRHGIGFDGPIVEDRQVRLSQQRATLAIIDAVAKLPAHAVVVAGWVLPRIVLALGGEQDGTHRFIYLVENMSDYQHFLDEGARLYYVPEVDRYESQAHELELAQLGAQPLDVPGELHRPASTGE